MDMESRLNAFAGNWLYAFMAGSQQQVRGWLQIPIVLSSGEIGDGDDSALPLRQLMGLGASSTMLVGGSVTAW